MYKITLSYDGNPVHFEKTYSDELAAFEGFLSFRDWGFADEFSTVNLFTPTGKCYTKHFYRNGNVVHK